MAITVASMKRSWRSPACKVFRMRRRADPKNTARLPSGSIAGKASCKGDWRRARVAGEESPSQPPGRMSL